MPIIGHIAEFHRDMTMWRRDIHAHPELGLQETRTNADDAAKEWAANVVPGITIIPSGTWGVNRAQEAGCSYCAGG
jgi:metal-dependent amidase/aminoacylase/carboxypeptidase family protein